MCIFSVYSVNVLRTDRGWVSLLLFFCCCFLYIYIYIYITQTFITQILCNTGKNLKYDGSNLIPKGFGLSVTNAISQRP